MRLNITADDTVSDDFKKYIEQTIEEKEGLGLAAVDELDVTVSHPASGGSDIIYKGDGRRFERIRRITGYL